MRMTATKQQQTATAVHVANVDEWATLLHGVGRQKPILTHLNADTTWLLQLPYPEHAPPPAGRTHFNVLMDPWLQGPQSDVAWWFSTQWHVVAPSVATIAELNKCLAELESRGCQSDQDGEEGELSSYIDVVAISHEFTDHCHQATLQELPTSTPVFATDVAADLIRGWSHFDRVITTPGLGKGQPWRDMQANNSPLPPWLAIGRVITPGNSLYYHSAVVIAFSQPSPADAGAGADAVVYSPHGIAADDLAHLPDSGIRTLALLHGLHDVGIWMAKQLNLGALNGLRAVRVSAARYWVATHDEIKSGGGLIAPFLRRTQYTVRDAVEHEEAQLKGQGEELPEYSFVDLGSGDGIVLQ